MDYRDFLNNGVLSQLDEVNRITERFREVERLTRPFDSLTADVNPLLQSQLTDSLQATQALADATISPMINSIPGIDEVSRYKLERPTSFDLLRDQLAGIDLTTSAQAISDLVRGDLLNADVLSASGLHGSLDSYVSSLQSVQSLLDSTCGSALLGIRDWDIAQCVAPTLSAIRDGVIQPGVGLLSTDDMFGIFTWAADLNEGVDFSTAAWFAEPPQRAPLTFPLRRVTVCCTVHCSICEERMIVEHEEHYMGSDSDLGIELNVVPLCPNCLRQAEANPDYWNESLSYLVEGEPPVLHLVRGDGQHAGEPRGRELLRLVDDDRDHEDE